MAFCEDDEKFVPRAAPSRLESPEEFNVAGENAPRVIPIRRCAPEDYSGVRVNCLAMYMSLVRNGINPKRGEGEEEVFSLGTRYLRNFCFPAGSK